jgi:hypothetical protein
MRGLQTFLASAVVLAASSAALAQDKPLTTSPDRPNTVKVIVTGNVVLDYVDRGPEITAFRFSASRNSIPTPVPPAVDTSDSENTFEGEIAVRLHMEMSDKVSVVLEIGTRRYDNDINNTFGAGPIGSGGESSADILLREAHVLLADLITPGLVVQLGVSTWSFDTRGRGNPMAFAPRQSQLFTRNIDSYAAADGQEAAVARFGEAGFMDTLDPVGATLTYTRGTVVIDLVLLPAMIEGGTPTDDEAMYAVDIWLKIDEKGSRVGVILGLNSFTSNGVPAAGNSFNNETAMITFGFGADIRMIEGLQIWGEFYIQRGDAGQIAAAVNEDTLDANGRAFQLGLEWRHTVGNPMPIWAGLSYINYSGDSDTTANQDVDRFASYEGMAELMIIESMDFGYDIDTNYNAIKLWAGVALTAASKDDLEISAMVGICKHTEDVTTPSGDEDGLGNEVDLHLKWNLSKQAALRLDLAMLFGSDSLEGAMGGSAAPDAEDSTMLWVLGADLRF